MHRELLKRGIACYGSRDITEIPELPLDIPITALDCSNNKLRKISVLPAALEWLQCHNNLELIELPPLPTNLYWLSMFNTTVSRLPRLSKYLHYLDITNTPISYLPILLSFTLESVYMFDTAIAQLPRGASWLVNCTFYGNSIKYHPNIYASDYTLKSRKDAHNYIQN